MTLGVFFSLGHHLNLTVDGLDFCILLANLSLFHSSWVRNLLVAGVAAYTAAYTFEYLTYTNAAKVKAIETRLFKIDPSSTSVSLRIALSIIYQERRFKAQFCVHATSQLKSLALENTSHNSFAMSQELNRNFSLLVEKVRILQIGNGVFSCRFFELSKKSRDMLL